MSTIRDCSYIMSAKEGVGQMLTFADMGGRGVGVKVTCLHGWGVCLILDNAYSRFRSNNNCGPCHYTPNCGDLAEKCQNFFLFFSEHPIQLCLRLTSGMIREDVKRRWLNLGHCHNLRDPCNMFHASCYMLFCLWNFCN